MKWREMQFIAIFSILSYIRYVFFLFYLFFGCYILNWIVYNIAQS